MLQTGKTMRETAQEKIVAYLRERPGYVAEQFGASDADGQTDAEFEAPSLVPGNWEYLDDLDNEGKVRCFNCEPYNDQLRAYVTFYPDGTFDVVVQGE